MRPVSALMSDDLPALERPAKAISVPFIGGSVSIDAAAQMKLPVAREQLAPVSISFAVKPGFMRISRKHRQDDDGVPAFFFEQFFDVVPEFDLGAMLLHDEGLRQHRRAVLFQAQ